jgi:hypothetical protein
LRDPFANLLVTRATRDEIPKCILVDARLAEEVLVEWATKYVIAVQANEGRTAFIERPGRSGFTAQFLVSGSRFLRPQIAGELFDSF